MYMGVLGFVLVARYQYDGCFSGYDYAFCRNWECVIVYLRACVRACVRAYV